MLRHLTRLGVSSLSAVRPLHSATAMDLTEVTAVLKKFAPPSLAGGWDNVGLLIEPSAPHSVRKMLLTNDLTSPVMEEAISLKVDMILSYHPPIFAALKRLRQCKWKERIVIQCLENRIALYSPHTSYDALKGGVNDWLIQPFKGQIRPLDSVTTNLPTLGKYKVEASVPADSADACLQSVGDLKDAKLVSKYWFEDANGHKVLRVSFNAKESGLSSLLSYFNQDDEIKCSVEVSELTKPIIPDHGAGRICQLEKGLPLSEAVNLVKQHLKLKHVRLAKVVTEETDPLVRSVAVCAGSGSSVLQGAPADLYLTGEMSHHEVLDATHTGHSVILCDHSNSERGYLSTLQASLSGLLQQKVELIVSTKDEDPLQII